MLSDPTTEWYSTSQQSALTASPRRGVVLHHGATTDVDWIIGVETSGSKQVSSNRVVKDSRCVKIVDDGARAWSLSDPYWDSVLRSIECANESTAGWTISKESHQTLARQVAWWSFDDTRNGQPWWPHRDGDPTTWTVLGHREINQIHGGSYATACPGGMDLDLVTRLAQSYLRKLVTTVMFLSCNKPDSARPAVISTPGWERVLTPAEIPHAKAFVADFGGPIFENKDASDYDTKRNLFKTGKFAPVSAGTVDVAALAQQAAALVKLPSPADIAKAVNDDAANRLKA